MGHAKASKICEFRNACKMGNMNAFEPAISRIDSSESQLSSRKITALNGAWCVMLWTLFENGSNLSNSKKLWKIWDFSTFFAFLRLIFEISTRLQKKAYNLTNNAPFEVAVFGNKSWDSWPLICEIATPNGDQNGRLFRSFCTEFFFFLGGKLSEKILLRPVLQSLCVP